MQTKIKRDRGFEVVDQDYRKYPNVVPQLPQRKTKYSAGYDFYSPISIQIPPHQTVCIETDIKAYMYPNEVLLLYIRSSLGIHKHLILSNCTGVIDSDFYNNTDNGGNITIALYNYGDTPVDIEAGDRIMQGVFTTYLIADSGNSNAVRTGGTGSTDAHKEPYIIGVDLAREEDDIS